MSDTRQDKRREDLKRRLAREEEIRHQLIPSVREVLENREVSQTSSSLAEFNWEEEVAKCIERDTSIAMAERDDFAPRNFEGIPEYNDGEEDEEDFQEFTKNRAEEIIKSPIYDDALSAKMADAFEKGDYELVVYLESVANTRGVRHPPSDVLQRNAEFLIESSEKIADYDPGIQERMKGAYARKSYDEVVSLAFECDHSKRINTGINQSMLLEDIEAEQEDTEFYVRNSTVSGYVKNLLSELKTDEVDNYSRKLILTSLQKSLQLVKNCGHQMKEMREQIVRALDMIRQWPDN